MGGGDAPTLHVRPKLFEWRVGDGAAVGSKRKKKSWKKWGVHNDRYLLTLLTG